MGNLQPVIMGALEAGVIYGLIALALFLSYSILNIADLSTDGCFTLGAAVGAQVALMGHPVLALFAAMGVGVCSGFVMSVLQTKLGVESILAGIIVNTGLYSINFLAMGSTTQLSVFKSDTVFSITKNFLGSTWYKLVVALIIAGIACVFLNWFLGTRLGLSIRATGDNDDMVKASSINPKLMLTVGLCVSGSLTGLSGSLVAQYNKACDINMGTGMVTIALASLIIGETIFGRKPIWVRIIGTMIGSCIYRFAFGIALRLHVPAEFMKLMTAVIVAAAIAAPYLKERLAFQRKKRAAMANRKHQDLEV